MRVISFNANGIRSAARKGFFDWLREQDADVVCIQEVRAQQSQLQDPIFYPEGYDCHYFDAERKGYSGTAIYCRGEEPQFSRGLGWEPADSEGRWLQADCPGLSIVSLYMPSGSAGEERQAVKFAFMEQLKAELQALYKGHRRRRREYIICADWNICHREIDLENWRANRDSSGFLPEERAWLDHLYEEVGWVDSFRAVEPGAKQYTWWSNRGRARENNVGWRLDYQLVTPGLAQRVQRAHIFRDQVFSDHAPLMMDYDMTLLR